MFQLQLATGIVPPQKNGPSACSKINWTIQNEKGVFEYVQSLILAFVCLFVLRFYGPVNPMGSCRVRSIYLTTLDRLSISIVHILSPETDNCPS